MRSLAWLLAFACSSGPGSPEHPRPPPPGDPTAPTAPSEPECDQLITHTVALGIDEQAARAEPHATASDHEAIRRALHEDFMAGCRALSRDAYRCAMAAATLAELARCQPAQRTPSSSTSNSSVAPGGMTPPAPRSP
ncbi:MAG: hypothetical protein E6J90_21885 [Deltaproteobacteria bacterium]|nr:MAG: hypothetical protein E6J91_46940 [Deltaproteobacteria bacterium]TMQ17739.1 MAG: hypothetical protein E6J90_21885 [Deltaproteobacteria bacterium]